MTVFGQTMNIGHIINDFPSRTEHLVGKQVYMYYHPEEESVICRNVLSLNYILMGIVLAWSIYGLV